jgi:hypothetical protein
MQPRVFSRDGTSQHRSSLKISSEDLGVGHCVIWGSQGKMKRVGPYAKAGVLGKSGPDVRKPAVNEGGAVRPKTEAHRCAIARSAEWG